MTPSRASGTNQAGSRKLFPVSTYPWAMGLCLQSPQVALLSLLPVVCPVSSTQEWVIWGRPSPLWGRDPLSDTLSGDSSISNLHVWMLCLQRTQVTCSFDSILSCKHWNYSA